MTKIERTNIHVVHSDMGSHPIKFERHFEGNPAVPTTFKKHAGKSHLIAENQRLRQQRVPLTKEEEEGIKRDLKCLAFGIKSAEKIYENLGSKEREKMSFQRLAVASAMLKAISES
jgi:hypothetical protein